MTPIVLRRTARALLALLALLAFAAFALPWLTRANGDVLIGFDIGYLAYGLGREPYPVTQLFTEVAQLPALLAVLLVPGVAVQSRWGRGVAVVLGLLAAGLAGFAAVGLFNSIEDYWEPARSTRYQLFAVAVAVVAVLVLAAVVALAAGRRRAYAMAVALLLVGAAAFHLGCVLVISSARAIGVELSPLAWAPAAAYLLAAGCAFLAASQDTVPAAPARA
ncbi:hypothetical protein AB0H57_25210 [Micromonospora sp. NPDC050686]|uniref:hypothetical protein n=1 Tax=Micromonospora sp. NPDC050686 TaxID=3154631 RepID=UPI0033EB968E